MHKVKIKNVPQLHSVAIARVDQLNYDCIIRITRAQASIIRASVPAGSPQVASSSPRCRVGTYYSPTGCIAQHNNIVQHCSVNIYSTLHHFTVLEQHSILYRIVL